MYFSANHYGFKTAEVLPYQMSHPDHTVQHIKRKTGSNSLKPAWYLNSTNYNIYLIGNTDNLYYTKNQLVLFSEMVILPS